MQVTQLLALRRRRVDAIGRAGRGREDNGLGDGVVDKESPRMGLAGRRGDVQTRGLARRVALGGRRGYLCPIAQSPEFAAAAVAVRAACAPGAEPPVAAAVAVAGAAAGDCCVVRPELIATKRRDRADRGGGVKAMT